MINYKCIFCQDHVFAVWVCVVDRSDRSYGAQVPSSILRLLYKNKTLYLFSDSSWCGLKFQKDLIELPSGLTFSVCQPW